MQILFGQLVLRVIGGLVTAAEGKRLPFRTRKESAEVGLSVSGFNTALAVKEKVDPVVSDAKVAQNEVDE